MEAERAATAATSNGLAQSLDSGIHWPAKSRERCDNSRRYQPTRHRVFHNGQTIFVFGELHYRSLDCLHVHFAHLTRMLFFLRQYVLRCLMQP